MESQFSNPGARVGGLSSPAKTMEDQSSNPGARVGEFPGPRKTDANSILQPWRQGWCLLFFKKKCQIDPGSGAKCSHTFLEPKTFDVSNNKIDFRYLFFQIDPGSGIKCSHTFPGPKNVLIYWIPQFSCLDLFSPGKLTAKKYIYIYIYIYMYVEFFEKAHWTDGDRCCDTAATLFQDVWCPHCDGLYRDEFRCKCTDDTIIPFEDQSPSAWSSPGSSAKDYVETRWQYARVHDSADCHRAGAQLRHLLRHRHHRNHQ